MTYLLYIGYQKPHKNPYSEGYFALSSVCSTEELSINMTNFLSAVKEGFNYTVTKSFRMVASIKCEYEKHLIIFGLVLYEKNLFKQTSYYT
jgi:hypothetical protein